MSEGLQTATGGASGGSQIGRLNNEAAPTNAARTLIELMGPPGAPIVEPVGPWEPLTVTAKAQAITGGNFLAIRWENGGRTARMRGRMEALSEIKIGESWATITNALLRPLQAIRLYPVVVGSGAGSFTLQVTTAGAISVFAVNVGGGVVVSLDGLTYDLGTGPTA